MHGHGPLAGDAAIRGEDELDEPHLVDRRAPPEGLEHEGRVDPNDRVVGHGDQVEAGGRESTHEGEAQRQVGREQHDETG